MEQPQVFQSLFKINNVPIMAPVVSKAKNN